MGSPGRLGRGVLPHQLCHGGRQDELGGGLGPYVVLYHDREFHLDMSVACARGRLSKNLAAQGLLA